MARFLRRHAACSLRVRPLQRSGRRSDGGQGLGNAAPAGAELRGDSERKGLDARGFRVVVRWAGLGGLAGGAGRLGLFPRQRRHLYPGRAARTAATCRCGRPGARRDRGIRADRCWPNSHDSSIRPSALRNPAPPGRPTAPMARRQARPASPSADRRSARAPSKPATTTGWKTCGLSAARRWRCCWRLWRRKRRVRALSAIRPVSPLPGRDLPFRRASP